MSALCLSSYVTVALAQTTTANMPWMDKTLSPRPSCWIFVLQQMTLDEKLQLVHGTGWGVLRAGAPVPERFQPWCRGTRPVFPASEFPTSISLTLLSVFAWLRRRVATLRFYLQRLASLPHGILRPAHFIR